MFIRLYQGFICKSFGTDFDGLRGKLWAYDNKCERRDEPLPCCYNIFEWESWHPPFEISGQAIPPRN